jgi:hypothetical protein
MHREALSVLDNWGFAITLKNKGNYDILYKVYGRVASAFAEATADKQFVFEA